MEALPQNINYRDNDKIIIKRNKIKYIVNRNDFTQWQIYANYPELHYEALSKWDQGNVIDVGANIGSFSLRVAKYFRDNKSNNKVYAFEPFQKIFNMLEKNLSFNCDLRENIILSETAISDKIDDEMVFEIVEKNFGANFLKKINKFSNNKKNILKTTTIDNLCEINKLENVSFVKIDVEGMEIEVLNGAKNLIDRIDLQYLLKLMKKIR